MQRDTLVEARNLSKHFRFRGRGTAGKVLPTVKAVNRISFDILRGEVLGLVGESGSGKTTVARLLSLLEKPTEGNILFDGVNIQGLRGSSLKKFRKRVQMIFQDPYESLDPRLTVHDAIYEPLAIHGIGSNKHERRQIVLQTLQHVGLRPPEDYIDRYPHELSGGQRQRVSIARATCLSPEFIVADEPVSMLDTSVRAGVLNLMLDLKNEMKISYLFVTHDLSVARYVSDRIIVMYYGSIVELGQAEKIVQKAMHPYTKLLMASVPIPDPEYSRAKVRSKIPMQNMDGYTEKCPFQNRCPNSREECRTRQPALVERTSGHWVACHI